MYYNHNLRTELQEWKNRLVRADYNQFGNQLKFFFGFIESNRLLNNIIIEINNKHLFEKQYFDKLDETDRYFDEDFDSLEKQVAFSLQLIKHMVNQVGYRDIHKNYYLGGDFKETASIIVNNLITPIVYFFHDKLDKSNSTIYLLEKYKRRVEWFTKKELAEKYKVATKEYEDILEDDLRLFLFDQGIDYPFSTPKSASGRTDIVGSIETENPLIVEIKILDKEKKYGINRIKSGFHQIVKYTEDYSKDVGYLVLYNFDKIRYDFKFNGNSNVFPPMLIFNNKVYYFIIIDMYSNETASKLGSIEKVEITEDELIKK